MGDKWPITEHYSTWLARQSREDRLASPDRTDRPLYAWLVEDQQVNTGTLGDWARDYVQGHYGGVWVSMDVVRLQVDGTARGYQLRGATAHIRISSNGRDAQDMMHFRARVEDSMGDVVDAADFVIDGRA